MRIIFFIIIYLTTFSIFCQSRDIKGRINSTIRDTCAGVVTEKIFPLKAVRVYLINNKSKKTILADNTDSLGAFKIKIDKIDLDSYTLFLCRNKFDTIIPIKNDIDSIQINWNNFSLIEIAQNDSFKIRIRAAKPAIYLYPTQEQKITVQLDFKGQLGTTYPKYNQSWNVIAKPNGEILNLADNRKYTYLFWEGDTKFPESHFNYQSGFVVAKDELDKFLLEKLAYIGLNNTEINDFIVYWLPQLEKNEYNLIHFFVNDNIDNSAFLDVKPKPDTQIRVFMEFKAVDKNYKITKQELPRIERKGFTLVEWGGGIIGSGKIE